jgi:glucosamine--fructose-6-phosphate aminotransferase (isomerizing)
MPNEELIPIEIHDTPAAIRATIKETRSAAKKATEAMLARMPRRIFLVGNGTSLYSCMAAAYTGRALANSADDPFVLAVPAGDFRHYRPSLSGHDVIVGISASGEFRDVVALFEELKGKCLCVGITHIPGSTITRIADELLISAGGPSLVPVMTKTYASTLTAAHLLLLEVFGATQTIFDDLEKSAERAEAAIMAAEERVPAIVAELKGFEHAFYFGAGSAYAAALESALKMKEMSMLHAEGSESWEYASGPATIVDEKFFCAALYTGSRKDEDTANSIQQSRQWGARVIEMGPQSVTGGWHFPVAASQFEPFSTLALVPPAALLAYRMARSRGQSPDTPKWRERYYSQGLKHILGA